MTTDKKNQRLALNIMMIAVGMMGLAYGSVPLYDLFCRVTGFAGTTQVADVAPEQISDRVITVRFNTDIARDLPWDFQPEQRQVQVHVGETKLVFFSAENKSDQTMVGTSIYNVTPDKAGAYFNKIECFCFDAQSLAAGSEVEFPVTFFIDPAMLDDPAMDDISTITLSYTFFKVKGS